MSDSPPLATESRSGGGDAGGPDVRLNKPVFYGSAIGVLLVAAWAILLPENADTVIGLGVEFIAGGFGWFYVLVATAVLAFVLFLAVSRYGNTRLGPDHSKPDFSNMSWAAMLFAAGIGTDLMFFSVAEPITQFTAPPAGEPGTVQAAREATVWTLFHYGLTGWGMYALMGIALAYFAYRRELPLSIRSALYPLIGKRVFGRIGHAVDLAAVLGTIFGVATSLGIAVVLLNVGLDVMFGVPQGLPAQVVLVVVAVVIATVSAVSGVDRGIKRLSELNVLATVLLAVFILVTGNTSFLLNALVTNLGDYLSSFPTLTMETFAFEQDDPAVGEWMNLWTLFFWAWWIAWASFVGLFLARISRGRTIRQFVLGAMAIPFFYILFWISIFGNAALESVRAGNTALADTAVNAPETGFYMLLRDYPWFPFLAGLATLTGLLFYVTSADSGALVMANLTSYRRTPRDDGSIPNRIFWAAATGLLTLGMLFVGGITTLQNATVIMGLPFAFVIVLVMFGLFRALRLERHRSESRRSSLPALLSGRSRDTRPGAGDDGTAGLDWRLRLRRTMGHADQRGADQFLSGTATAVLEDVAAELRNQGVPTRVQRCDDSEAPELEPGEARPEGTRPLELVADVHETLPFVYRLVPRITGLPRYSLDGDGTAGDTRSSGVTDWTDHHRVEVHLHGGGQGYNVMGYSYGQLIDDVLDQYEQHLEVLRLEREAAP
ncbi:choline BCCT transporter BetT [Pseudonocardia sp. C8]|uniref:choline BCCT transporter BetT n=1 Tax=Pseudonocardia sp. C8 TaxID=2762759 RepID=UPI001642838B|nr:choline BCCT transporter BetT [Pseudonocardia sp. C8]MBC3192704.1 choline BCCT transporter BetT [Pseudonocardia sp. C8]